MSDEVTTTLAQVAAALPGGGESREGQRQMASSVGRSIAARRHLVVQAGTGTGKSLAYLVPAALSGQRVVVATATKALQDQLAHNDLPLVADALAVGLSFAVLKGRSNYLCRQRVVEVGGRRRSALPVGRRRRRARRRRSADRRRRQRPPPVAGSPTRSGNWSRWSSETTTPGTGPSWTSNRTSGPGPWSRPPPATARAPSGARRGTTASPRTPGPGPPRPTWWWSTPISTGPTWPAGAPCSRRTRWSSSTRPTRSKR